ncbi:MAG TPA: sulfur carrier protein ThiS [Burkholderiaceae bacterium]|jgi:sulfur carrier protein
MIDIELNGAPHRVEDEQSLSDLIASLSLPNQAMAVAVNRQVVPRQAWVQRQLQSQDRVDIVRAIGGG